MQAVTTPTNEEKISWLDRPFWSGISITWETILFSAILILAVFTRFYILGVRVMSHDETSHVYFSWLLYQGRGYQHDPITHGPFQFHIVALTYFLLGDNDFTARIPSAVFGIAAIVFVWKFRRYLGRKGALISALLLTISPYILFYDRYVRNESFVVFVGLILLWAVLRYLETGIPRYLYYVTAAVVLHFTIKETAYIYSAQILLFLAFYFIYQVTKEKWQIPAHRNPFLLATMGGLVLFIAALAFRILAKNAAAGTTTLTPTATPSAIGLVFAGQLGTIITGALAGIALLLLAVAAYYLLTGFTLRKLRSVRSFDLLFLIGTLILPLLTAFPLDALHWTVPISAAAVNAMTSLDMVHMGIMLAIMFLIAISLGIWWNARLWIRNAVLFYAIFIFFYTTFFTNGAGLFTGLLGSLGYWLAQQAVNRGSQPWYYYLLIQVPVYEYLPALGSILALVLALLGRRAPVPDDAPLEEPDHELIADPDESVTGAEAHSSDLESIPIGTNSAEAETELEEWEPQVEEPSRPGIYQRPPILALLGFWTITSLLAYTVAGEKMPWLTVHITFPMILLSGWSLGTLIESIHWKSILNNRGLLVLALLPVFLTALAGALASVLGTNPPFQGKSLDQLAATSTFLIAFVALIVSGWALVTQASHWPGKQVFQLGALTFFAILAVLTARAAFTVSFINYNDANELLVYAHAGPGVKTALSQIEEISKRTTNGLALQVAYDSDTTYPYWWYLRDYPNQRYYGSNPTRDLNQVPVILVGDTNFSKLEPIVGQAYYSFDYIRMWWPNQDYFNLTWNRIWNAISNPQWRAAIFQIWLNRDYTQYGQLANEDTSLANWSPSAHMRLYIRKDIVAQIWNYGVAPSSQPVAVDPYAGKQIKVGADQVIGTPGNGPGQFVNPRNLAIAPDGSIYVADSGNNRIQHLSRTGDVLQVFGAPPTIPDRSKGEITPAGTLNEPWGVAVGKDGSVYVSDTWNHRIDKFTADGKFVKSWGVFGKADSLEALWGPRGIAIDSLGRVLVADTGNKRIVVYDADGNPISQVGGEGSGNGQFNEPTGIALDQQDNLYVADTWNQRVQVFSPDGKGGFTFSHSWDISGWYGQSLDNKPFITVDNQDYVYVTDPEGYRVLQFDSQGKFIRFWGDNGSGLDTFGIANGIVADPQGGVWLADSGNSRLMHFTLPPVQ